MLDLCSSSILGIWLAHRLKVIATRVHDTFHSSKPVDLVRVKKIVREALKAHRSVLSFVDTCMLLLAREPQYMPIHRICLLPIGLLICRANAVVVVAVGGSPSYVILLGPLLSSFHKTNLIWIQRYKRRRTLWRKLFSAACPVESLWWEWNHGEGSRLHWMPY